MAAGRSRTTPTGMVARRRNEEPGEGQPQGDCPYGAAPSPTRRRGFDFGFAVGDAFMRPARRSAGDAGFVISQGRLPMMVGRRGGSGTARFEGKTIKTLDSGLRRNDGRGCPYGGERGVCDFAGAAPPRGRPTIREPPDLKEDNQNPGFRLSPE